LFLFQDVDGITNVINFDFPQLTEDYIHRIGRTGRSDNKGTATTYFTLNNAKQANELVNVLEEAGQKVPDQLLNWSRRFGSGNRNSNFRSGTFKKNQMSSFGNNRAPNRFDSVGYGGGGGGGSGGGQSNKKIIFDDNDQSNDYGNSKRSTDYSDKSNGFNSRSKFSNGDTNDRKKKRFD
jgi:superfamily II DNA/RNA helicase